MKISVKKLSVLFLILGGILVISSCSRRYNRYPYRRRKRKKCDCPKWSKLEDQKLFVWNIGSNEKNRTDHSI